MWRGAVIATLRSLKKCIAIAFMSRLIQQLHIYNSSHRHRSGGAQHQHDDVPVFRVHASSLRINMSTSLIFHHKLTPLASTADSTADNRSTKDLHRIVPRQQHHNITHRPHVVSPAMSVKAITSTSLDRRSKSSSGSIPLIEEES